MANRKWGSETAEARLARESEAVTLLTENAYEFGLSYSRREWKRIVRFLLGAGYSPRGAEEVVRSKHMRWAADSELTGGDMMTLEKFESYWVHNERSARRMLKAECPGLVESVDYPAGVA